jgi:hypothetical protein
MRVAYSRRRDDAFPEGTISGSFFVAGITFLQADCLDQPDTATLTEAATGDGVLRALRSEETVCPLAIGSVSVHFPHGLSAGPV